ncbi:MAG: alkaline phosphatase PhoX [Dehalococcoidia bacterium]
MTNLTKKYWLGGVAFAAGLLAIATASAAVPNYATCQPDAIYPGTGSAADNSDPVCYAVALEPARDESYQPVGDQRLYDVVPLLSVGDSVPHTEKPGAQYQMVGIPDGLGAAPISEFGRGRGEDDDDDRDNGHGNDDGVYVFMNHEFTSSVTSQPELGPGAVPYRGSFVSRWELDEDGNVLEGDRAYDTVFNENVLVGPADAAATRPFSRFCSGFLSVDEGLDRPIYFTNEEESNIAATFDGKGGVSVAIFDDELHTLPKLGHFAKENTVVQPDTGRRTVIITLEDGPQTPNSQLYMYVGTKDRGQNASVLRRNGLDNGTLYFFAATGDETTFQAGTISGTWEPVPNAENLTDAQIEAYVQANGSFDFIRLEDGAFNENDNDLFHFVTTGDGTGNRLGRLYTLKLNSSNPTGSAQLHVEYNGDQVDAAGLDAAFAPDNIDVSGDYLMINEDGTGNSRPEYDPGTPARSRDASIWRIPLRKGGDWKERVKVDDRVRVAELDDPGRDGVEVGPGIWETSGIIDTSDLFGDDTWLFDVQAHNPTSPPDRATQVEDGQLLLMFPVDEDDDDDEEEEDEDDDGNEGDD